MADSAERKNKPRVLVADDERSVADTLVIILQQAGFDATAVYNGGAAIALASELRPDIMITDVMMPGMNGIESAIQIREMLPNCRIVISSGQTATVDLLESARARGHEFEILAKPFHPHDLLAKLLG